MASAAGTRRRLLRSARTICGLEGDDAESLRSLAGDRLRLLFLKRAARGGLLADLQAGEPLSWPARAETVVDVTGAGDAFAGGFLAGWLTHGDTSLSIAQAVVSASLRPRRLGLPRAVGGHAPRRPGPAGEVVSIRSRFGPRGGRLAMSRPPFLVAEAVAAAITAGRPVVALETTVVTHGFPSPDGLRVAAALEGAVRGAGAVPATIGILGGAGARRPLGRRACIAWRPPRRSR